MLTTIPMTVWTALVLIIDTLVMGAAVILLAPFSKTGRLTFFFCRAWAWVLFKTHRLKIQIEGREHLQKNRSYVFMSNHASHLDPPAAALALSHPLRFVAKASLARIPVFGLATRMAKMIFIDRENNPSALERLNKSISELRDGISAYFFAEGTRSVDGRLMAFKKGGVMLALKARLPIVPVTITNSHDLLPKNKMRIRPGIIRVIISPPIETAGYDESGKDDLLAKVRSVISRNLMPQAVGENA